MALNIKNKRVEQLASEVAALQGCSKTEAIRVALEERKARLTLVPRGRKARLRAVLQEEIWPLFDGPLDPWGQEQEDALLGYGEHGA